jgi:hypothetical protein
MVLRLSASERRDLEHFAPLRPLRPSEPAEATLGFSDD